MQWNLRLHDSKILSVERTEKSLTLTLDCSGTFLSPNRYVKQLIFNHYKVLEDSDLTNCFWLREHFTSKGAFQQLQLVAQKKRHRKFFTIQFRSVDVIHEN